MRWIVRGVVALVVMAGLAFGALMLIPAEKVGAFAIAEFGRLTGRTLTIEGAVRPSLWPVLGVRTGAVTVSNAEWSGAGPMFRAAGLDISLDMAALVGGDVRITAITAEAPELLLERLPDGRANWNFGGENGGEVSATTPGVGAPFTLLKGVAKDGRLTFLDHGAGREIDLTGIEAEIAIPDYEGAARLEMSALAGGQPFAGSLDLGAFRPFLDGEVVPVTLNAAAGDARLAFGGRAGWNPMVAEGQIDADLADLPALGAVFGMELARMPVGMGAERLGIAGGLTLTKAASVHLRDGKVTMDSTVLSGDADLVTEGLERPALKARLAGGMIDVSGGTGGGGSGGGAASAGWSDTPMDASGLRLVDADVALSTEGLVLGAVRLGPGDYRLHLESGRAEVTTDGVGAYGGTLLGRFVVNARKGLSVGGDLDFRGVDLETLLGDMNITQRLSGAGDLRVKFLGAGASTAAIMASLEGDGSLAVGPGNLSGLDIGAILSRLDLSGIGGDNRTDFDGLSASFGIAGGVMATDDMVMTGREFAATGRGKVDLGARRIDLRLRAEGATTAEGKAGLVAPILIRGPWADPVITVDLEALAAEQLKDDVQRLKDEAAAKVEALKQDAQGVVQDQLGVQTQPGETPEQALKRQADEALKQEAAKALEKLLGGGN